MESSTLVIVFGVGIAVLAVIMVWGFSTVRKSVDRQALFERRRHRILVGRERAVLAASVIGELNDNKNKCQAFITIYSEMLKSLRDETRKPAYQQTGDFIHKTPALSRTVYDSNLVNMSSLDADVSSRLAEVYSSVEADPEYLSLEPDMPIDTAIRMVEMVVKNAENQLDVMDKVIPSLEVAVRNAPRVSL